MKRLDEKVAVSGQVHPEDLPDLARAGVRTLINNRPDGEEPGQPSAADLADAARKAGLAYHEIPIARGFPDAAVQDMADALETSPGPALAFCKSGTRSTYLWALARARAGDDPEELRAKAEAAGYDLSPIAPLMQSH